MQPQWVLVSLWYLDFALLIMYRAHYLFGPAEGFPVRRLTGYQHMEAEEPFCMTSAWEKTWKNSVVHTTCKKLCLLIQMQELKKTNHMPKKLLLRTKNNSEQQLQEFSAVKCSELPELSDSISRVCSDGSSSWLITRTASSGCSVLLPWCICSTHLVYFWGWNLSFRKLEKEVVQLDTWQSPAVLHTSSSVTSFFHP